ncbi:MAG: FtsB family cell division protein [Candidatus Levyibacteriota bacterium]
MKRIFFIIGIFLSLIIIGNFITSIYHLWKKQDLLTQAQNQLLQEQKENKNLKKQLGIVNSQSFIEEEARNKLFLVKPGESEVLIPEDMLQASLSATISNVQRPFWQQWLALFF